MHILLIDFHFYEYTISLANALTTQARVSLLVPTNFESVADALAPEVELVYFSRQRWRSSANLKMLKQIWRAIRRLQPDVVHLVAINPWVNMGLIIQHPQPLVTTIHDPVKHAGDQSQDKVPQFVRNLPIHYSHRLIVHGQAMKEIMLKQHALSPDRLVVIHHGEFSIYRHWNSEVWPEREGMILFFGRIWPYKGLDYLIAAEPAISAAYPEACFVIAGRGENFYHYRRMMVNPERFEILNKYIPHKDVPQLFQQASVVVLPYTEASQSGVIPLAYAFGKPVVATTVGSIPEIVDDGITGYLVPPRDTDRLANAIIRLLQDKAMRQRMGQNALEKTQNELSWTTIAQQTMKVYWAVQDEI